jgi:hypothetical protein
MIGLPSIRGFSWVLSAALLVATSVILVPRATQASIMMALDLPELVRQSEHIAVVEVVSVRAAWDERHERIYSTIDLKVLESWKTSGTTTAPSVDHMTIVQAGGTVGDMTMTVMGMGTFAAGERSLVFLRGPANRAQVVGMTQGKRAMRYETTSRSWLVAPPDLRQAKLVRVPDVKGPTLSTPHPGSASVSAVGLRELPIGDLRGEVKRLLGAAQP